MLNPIPNKPLDEPPFQPDTVLEFDWSGRLSIEMVRQHTKTDDVPGVTDEQLRLYRQAAIEAAEHYTGLMLRGQRTMTEPIRQLGSYKPGKNTYRYTLRYPVADGVVHMYGGIHPEDNRTFLVPPGTRRISVPIRFGVDLTNCCDPCAKNYLNNGMMVAYRAGFKCAEEVPTGVVLGCLQYIAWTLEHPGDELLTSRNRVDSRSGGVQGTNNIAYASGAIETWRTFYPEAI